MPTRVTAAERVLPDSLQGMLKLLDRRSPEARIELGLERVRRVFARMEFDAAAMKIVTIGGTNGKGSTVAFIESILLQAGRRCMAYTSPHFLDFSERFRLDGQAAAHPELAAALRGVELAREGEELTWFEHVTLAALWLASKREVEWLLLEVGLGGRLDAVNIVDPDVAVITSIGLDHQNWLGTTRSAIAREKCGIARPGRPLVVAEKDLPPGMAEMLDDCGADLRLAGRDLNWRWSPRGLNVRIGGERFSGLEPGLAGRHQGGNVAAAVAAVLAVEPEIEPALVSAGIRQARLGGRFQKLVANPDVIVDVAHNPAAARVLRDQLKALPGRRIAVFSALQDKDIEGIVRVLDEVLDHWYAVGLDGPRGLTGADLAERIRRTGVGGSVEAVESVAEALDCARNRRESGQRVDGRAQKVFDGNAGGPATETIIVFGSFLTVAAALAATSP